MTSSSRTLLALIGGQISLHSCMTGVRVAAPLLALREHHSTWAVGVLLGLFAAAPVLVVMWAGRLADRRGYHRPLHVAVASSVLGGVVATAATFVPDRQLAYVLLCLAATGCGVGTHVGLVTLQRTASRLAGGNPAELTRVFSWTGHAPAMSNVIGPVVAGLLIDSVGFGGAFAALLLMPLVSLVCAARVPREQPAQVAGKAARRSTGSLFAVRYMKRLLLVSWLLSSSWDLHAFVVPVLGYERGISASAIGLILGVFAAAVAGVRVVMPFVAERLDNARVLLSSMLLTAAVFGVYPLMAGPWGMGACAATLGLALGMAQPVVLTTLHHLTPEGRHGESIALRSMTTNALSTVMPLLFGAAGSAWGAGPLFWLMGAAVGLGSWEAKRVGEAAGARCSEADA